MISISRNDLASELTGVKRFDSTSTFKEFDQRSNHIKNVSVTNGDTTGVDFFQYDEYNRLIKHRSASLDFGTSSYETIYGIEGNAITEIFTSDEFYQKSK